MTTFTIEFYREGFQTRGAQVARADFAGGLDETYRVECWHTIEGRFRVELYALEHDEESVGELYAGDTWEGAIAFMISYLSEQMQ